MPGNKVPYFEATLRYMRLLKCEGWKGPQEWGLGLKWASRLRGLLYGKVILSRFWFRIGLQFLLLSPKCKAKKECSLLTLCNCAKQQLFGGGVGVGGWRLVRGREDDGFTPASICWKFVSVSNLIGWFNNPEVHTTYFSQMKINKHTTFHYQKLWTTFPCHTTKIWRFSRTSLHFIRPLVVWISGLSKTMRPFCEWKICW